MHVVPGTYRHWKGRHYLVLGLGHDANDPTRTTVVYLPLHPVDGPPFAVRTLADFAGWVEPSTGKTAVAGDPGAVRRFEPVDPGGGLAAG